MPNVKIKNDVVTAKIQNPLANVRVSSFQTGVLQAATTGTLLTGMPLGILLAITYSQDTTTTNPAVYFSDFRPNVKIQNI